MSFSRGNYVSLNLDQRDQRDSTTQTRQLLLLLHQDRLEDICALDHDVLHGLVGSASLDAAELVDNIHTLYDLAEHSVLAIEVRSRTEGDEELASIGAGTGVGHAKRTLAVVLERRYELVLELGTVDGGAACTGSSRVTALNHEAWDDTVEDDVVVFTGGCESGKVLTGLVAGQYQHATSVLGIIKLTLGVWSLKRAMVMSPRLVCRTTPSALSALPPDCAPPAGLVVAWVEEEASSWCLSLPNIDLILSIAAVGLMDWCFGNVVE